MPSSFMPDVQVDIAFNAGYTTPAASRTWTDVSAYVELADRINIAFGRQDERSTADANQLTLTLDNTDGRFTALRAASPYYPNVKIGRPIRVRVTPPGGSTSTRFVGFIDEWPVEWDGTDSYAMAKVRASSRLARLGLSAKLRSMIESAVLAYRPSYYYTLGEPTGSTTAADSSGYNDRPLVIGTGVTSTPGPASPTFGDGTGPGTDGLTACVFPADSYGLQGYELSAAPSMWAAAFNIASAGAVVYLIRVLGRLPTLWVLSAEVSATGVLLVKNSTGTTVITGPNVADGSTHFLTVSVDGANATLYLDGTAVGSGALLTPTSPLRLDVGGVVGAPGVTMSHVVGFPFPALTAPQVADLAQVVLTGASGERTDVRLLRLLGWAGVAATEVTTDTGGETMTYQQTSGQSVVDALRDVESTENGVLFDDRDGNVRFRNRSHRYLATAAATLNMAAQHVGADYAPKLDRSALVNDVEVSNPTTGEKARATSTASSTEYGVATASATSVANTYDALQQKANWIVGSSADPRIRVPSLTVDVVAHQGLTPSAQTLLGLTVGDLLAVTNAPTQADTTSPSYFIEGYTESIGVESYEITYNLSPTYPTLNVFVLGDATRGQLDSTYVLAL